MSNILRNVFFVAAILNFKMADIGTIEKNGTKANFVPWTIMIKKNLGSKNVAEFLAKYITAYTTMSVIQWNKLQDTHFKIEIL